MEAFILADRVLASEHMNTIQAKPKYLKKYELSSTPTPSRKRPSPTFKPYHPILLLNAPRTKHLLKSLQ